MAIRLIVVFFALLILRSVHAGEVHTVSAIQLIATPDLFDGQEVRVIGFLHVEFEGDAVYLHREDFEYSIEKNSVAIELNESQMRAWKKLNNHYVIVEGRFSSQNKGHLDARSGTLQNVSRLSNWPAKRVRNQRNIPK